MKKLGMYILSILCGLCMVFGLAFALNTNEASADASQETTPTLSTTKYKISKSYGHMLLATGIKNYEDVYEVGYAFRNAEGIEKYHAVTTQYYTSITSGNSTWTVADMFGSDYTGMIVWEIAYDAAEEYTYQAYAKVGERVDGKLVASDNIVYGTRKDLTAEKYSVTFMSDLTFIEARELSCGAAYGELPEAPAKKYAQFKGWYLNEEGTGAPLTAETLVTFKGDHTVYAVYEGPRSYDFTTADQASEFSSLSNGLVEINTNEGYLKLSPVEAGDTSAVNNPQAEFLFSKALSAGLTVEVDFQLVGSINVGHGVWTYGVNASGRELFSSAYYTAWDTPNEWNNGKFTAKINVTDDCAGIKFLVRFANNADAYWKINAIRIIEPVEYPMAYDFLENKQKDEFSSLNNGLIAINTNEGYLKLSPAAAGDTSAVNNPQAEFLFSKALSAGLTVEVDFQLVGSIKVGHGVWTYGVNASGRELFSSAYYTAWDTPNEWNNGKFTAKINVTDDCAGIKFLVRFANNADAYWKITSIRILNGETLTSTVTYVVDGKTSTQNVAYNSAYGELPSAPAKDGYTFKGWYLNAAGEGEQVTANTLVKIAKDHSLYAVYTKNAVVEEERTEYDFTTADQINDFGNAKNVAYEIVDGYLKVVGQVSSNDNFLVLNKELKAGQKVTVDVEYVCENPAYSAGQVTFLTYGSKANGDSDGNMYAVMGNAPWDGGWKCTKITILSEIKADCAGLRMQFVMNSEAGAYFKITNVHIYQVGEDMNKPTAYDFTTEAQKDEFSSLNNGLVEINTNEGYLKLSPVDKTISSDNMPQAEFLFSKALSAGLTVEVDFELVGSINVGHGVWTYGVNASGSNVFSSAYYTAWDKPNEWNKGKFTAKINVTDDCAGIKFLVRFAKNADAYWKINGVRIYKGEAPTYTVTYNVEGATSTQSVTLGANYSNLPTAPQKAYAEFKGWYLNAEGTGKQITANTKVNVAGNHTLYAVYQQYYANPDFFEEEQLFNVVNHDNTKITHVRDASGNYLKLQPIETGDTSSANYPQSYFLFNFPYLTAGMFVEMDFELVGDINVGHGVWTWGANANGNEKFNGHFVTAWDAGDIWNNGKFTATTEITEDCEAILVRLRYANNTKAYWKLTGIRVYTTEEYCDVPTYANNTQIDVGGTAWVGTNQTLNYFNGEAGQENFAKLQEAGVTVLAGTFYGNTGAEEDDVRLLDLAAEYNIGLFFQKNWDGTSVPSYVSHKAFLGYYIDEPAKSDLSSLKTLQEKWNQSAFGANGKLLYVNLLPVYSGNAGNSYDAYVQQAIETCGLSIVSFDHYLMYYARWEEGFFTKEWVTSDTLSLRTDWLKNFDIASYYANKNDKPFWYTLLTTQHLADGDTVFYKDPTVVDLTYQMYVAMTYGATNLMHYTFAGTGDYIINGSIFNQNTGEFTQTYEDVKAANAIIGEWDHVFMNFDWLGVSALTGTSAQTGLIKDLTHAVSVDEYGVISSATSTQDVLVGHFQDKNGYDGVMVTNLTIPENATSANVSLTFSNEYEAVVVYQNGTETLVYLKDGKLSLNVASAGSVFLVPVKAK